MISAQASSDDVRISLPGYTKHPLHAVLVFLEYEIRPLQDAGSTQTFTVALGCGVYVPFDGKKLRLRSGRDPRYVELELLADATCRSTARNFVFPPSSDEPDAGVVPGDDLHPSRLEKYAKGKLVAFELRAYSKHTELPDDTPDRNSDESSDDDDDDNNPDEEPDDDELDDSDDADEDDEVPATLPSSPRRRRREKRRTRRPRPEDSDEEDDEDDESVAESLRTKLVLAKEGIAGESSRRWDRLLTQRDDEAARWRSAAPKGSSLLAQTLAAPLHRFGEATGGAVGPTLPTANLAVAPATTDDLTRAQRARLSRHGYPTGSLDDDDLPTRTDRPRYDLRLEATDPLSRHDITVQFAAYRSTTQQLPRAVYFTFQFYNLAPTRTERLLLADGSGSERLLVRDTGREPPLVLKYVVDTTTRRPKEAELFATYLATKTMYVDCWDAESRLHLGVAAVPLDRLLRQRSPVAKVAAEHTIVLPDGMVDHCGAATSASASSVAGSVVGYVQVVLCNYGETGSSPGLFSDSEDEVGPEVRPEVDSDLDWRRHASSTAQLDAPTRDTIFRGNKGAVAAAFRASYEGRPASSNGPRHRVRARPLTETSSELSAFLASKNKGGLFSAAKRREKQRNAGQLAAVAPEANAVTYDEVLQMVRRFRDSEKGRVKYLGPLLSLLEAPNFKVIEDHLVRVLTNAEKRGTSLERAFACFDADRGGTISLVEFEDALRALGCFRGPAHTPAGVTMLLKRFDTNNDGVIQLSEFIRYVRTKQQTKDTKMDPKNVAVMDARIKALLLKAESLGVSVVDAFKEFDKDGNGRLTEDELHQAFTKMLNHDVSRKDIHDFCKAKDVDGDGTISLSELLHLVGRDYADHLELKLKRILDDIETRGVRVADAFAAWDSDGDGILQRHDLEHGFSSLLEESQKSDVVKAVLDRLDGDDSGTVDIHEFYKFAGRDYGDFLEARLRTVLAVAERDFNVPPDAAFREWDKDKGGTISTAELRRGLGNMGGLFSQKNNLTSRDVEILMARIDRDGSGVVSLREFLAFVGCDLTAILAHRLRSVLFKAEERNLSLDAVFNQWDTAESGTISRSELKAGILALGTTFAADVVAAQAEESSTDEDPEVEKLITVSFDENGDGEISTRELYMFMGRDPATEFASKLRKVIHTSGIGAEEAFKHFDKDGDGRITRQEVAAGVRELPGFDDLAPRDAAALAAMFDVDDDGAITSSEFARQIGQPGVDDAEAELLRSLRAAVQEPFGSFGVGRAALEQVAKFRTSKNGVLDANAFASLIHDDLLSGHKKELNNQLVFERLAKTTGGVAVGDFLKFCRRGGVATPLELAQDHGEPVATPKIQLEPPATLDKLGKLLVTYEDAQHGDLEEAFRTLDADGSGTLTAKELYDGLRSLSSTIFGDLTRADAARIVHQLDNQQKNAVDLHDLQNFVAKYRSKNYAAPPKKKKTKSDAKKDAIATKLRTVLRRAEVGGASLRDAFDHFDTDKNKRLSPKEIVGCLHDVGPDLFKDVSENDIRELIRSKLDVDDDGEVDVQEFIAFVRKDDDDDEPLGLEEETGHSPLGPDSPKTQADLMKETLRAIVLRAEQMGTSLSATFGALDIDESGRLHVGELLKGLRKLGVFQDLDTFAVEKLVFDALDKDGSGTVDLEEFLSFIRGGPSSESSDPFAEARKEEREDIQALAQGEYEFAVDPDTRAVEKKLRRAARHLAAQGGDVRSLFEQYDPDRSGAVVRSDFVQILMQLGLSLLDAEDPAGHEDDDDPSTCLALRDPSDAALRKRQMMQLAKIRKGGMAPRLLKLRDRQSLSDDEDFDSRRRRRPDDDDDDNKKDWDELALVKWYREGYKRDMVRSLLAKSMRRRVRIYPSFGQTAWFEFALQNPFARAERIAVVVTSTTLKSLRVVTSAEEWSHLRRHVPPAQGHCGNGAVEADMVDVSGKDPVVMLMANEQLRIPFAYLGLDPPTHELRWGDQQRRRPSLESKDESDDEAKGSSSSSSKKKKNAEEPAAVTTVKFIASGGFVVGVLEVEMYPRPCVVDRTFRFYQAEGEILKRCIRVLPNHSDTSRAPSSMLGAIAPRNEQPAMYVHAVPAGRGSTADVSLSWQPSETVAGAHEVLLKYARVGAFPSVGEFFVLVFTDRFCATLSELWHVVVHSRLRADANGVAGQAVGVELVVRGDRSPRVVRAFAGLAAPGGDQKDVAFDPPTDFRLVPNAHNKFGIHYRPRLAGNTQLHVHLVDVDTHDLIAAWILNAVRLSFYSYLIFF